MSKFIRKYELYFHYPSSTLSNKYTEEGVESSSLTKTRIKGNNASFSKASDKADLITDLHIEVSVSSDKETDNHATIKIFNLKKDSVEKISRKDTVVVLRAGYEEDKQLSTIISGQIVDAETVSDNSKGDRITTIYVKDSYVPYSNLKVSENFVNKTKREIIESLVDIAVEGGLPKGRLFFNNTTRKVSLDRKFPSYSVEGRLVNRIKEICQEVHHRAYIVGGSLYVEPIEKPPLEETYVVLPENIIGRVEKKDSSTESADKIGIKFTTLLDGNIRLGKKIKVPPDYLPHSISKVDHELSYEGNSWFTIIEADRI